MNERLITATNMNEFALERDRERFDRLVIRIRPNEAAEMASAPSVMTTMSAVSSHSPISPSAPSTYHPSSLSGTIHPTTSAASSGTVSPVLLDTHIPLSHLRRDGCRISQRMTELSARINDKRSHQPTKGRRRGRRAKGHQLEVDEKNAVRSLTHRPRRPLTLNKLSDSGVEGYDSSDSCSSSSSSSSSCSSEEECSHGLRCSCSLKDTKHAEEACLCDDNSCSDSDCSCCSSFSSSSSSSSSSTSDDHDTSFIPMEWSDEQHSHYQETNHVAPSLLLTQATVPNSSKSPFVSSNLPASKARQPLIERPIPRRSAKNESQSRLSRLLEQLAHSSDHSMNARSRRSYSGKEADLGRLKKKQRTDAEPAVQVDKAQRPHRVRLSIFHRRQTSPDIDTSPTGASFHSTLSTSTESMAEPLPAIQDELHASSNWHFNWLEQTVNDEHKEEQEAKTQPNTIPRTTQPPILPPMLPPMRIESSQAPVNLPNLAMTQLSGNNAVNVSSSSIVDSKKKFVAFDKNPPRSAADVFSTASSILSRTQSAFNQVQPIDPTFAYRYPPQRHHFLTRSNSIGQSLHTSRHFNNGASSNAAVTIE